MARPKIQFTDQTIKKIEQLALAQAKDYTIAEGLGIAIMTFKRHFGKKCKQKRAEGKLKLLQTQAKMAETVPTMAIWLGKQHLEQTDKQDINRTGDGLTVNIAREKAENSLVEPKPAIKLVKGA